MKKLKPLRRDVNYDLSNCSDEELNLICEWLVMNDKGWNIEHVLKLKANKGIITYSEEINAFGWWYKYKNTIKPEFVSANKELLSMTRSRNAYKQMWEKVKEELQEKNYFIEEFRMEVSELEQELKQSKKHKTYYMFIISALLILIGILWRL